MRKAGISDYKAFALQALQVVTDRPISFEVFADDFGEMEKQALEIASWGKNVNVKIPVTNTKGEFAGPLVERLSRAGVQLNVTALMTLDQVQRVTRAPRGRNAGDHLGVRRAHRRYRARSDADHGRGGEDDEGEAEGRTDLGEPARAAQHLPGRRRSAATSSPRPTTS